MHYTIYFNEKSLILSDSKAGLAEQLLQQPDTVFQNQLDKASVRNMIQSFQNETTASGVFLHHDLEKLLQAFKGEMKLIKAGGGLVHTDGDTVLLIFRRGKWDLPKGKLDAGETTAEAALREVREETGLQALHLEAPLTVTYHTYYEKSSLILKESHWFLMKSKEQDLIPQVEEDIEKCEWVKMDSLAAYFKNAHPSVIDVLKTGIEKLHFLKNS